VIHTVGPVWHGGDRGETQLLASCYENSLSLAVELGAKSVAFPAISCGVYRFPVKRAAQIATRTVTSFLSGDASLDQVLLIAFDSEMGAVLRAELERSRTI
jgi:O-acetyl-ADP-ribose deacetylase (regulator of RNase III)